MTRKKKNGTEKCNLMGLNTNHKEDKCVKIISNI